MEHLSILGKKLRNANIDLDLRNDALLAIAAELEKNIDSIIRENNTDMARATSNHDRLMLDDARIRAIAAAVCDVAKLPDPLATPCETLTRPNGMQIEKRRVPLGVVGMIYESRPNVTVDAAVLCIKSGNAVLLRGGADALNSNRELVRVMKSALKPYGMHDILELVTDTSRETASAMMRLDKYLDVLIPRGGANLIRTVRENATVPIIETGTGNCHVYIDEHADLAMGVKILINAKAQRPSVCNSAETLLLHKSIADKFLTMANLENHGIELRYPATEHDLATEFNDLILAVQTVDNIDDAITHINEYGTRHSECIVTQNKTNAQKFLSRVDAACVYHNVSTRYSDGCEFGMGAEIGISTQKLHTRGPFALDALTTYKYVITGNGQTRGEDNNMKIGFIGHGNMARAMISRIGQKVEISDGERNQAVIDASDIIFLTIKPQIHHAVLSTLKNLNSKILVTVAPGITIKTVMDWSGARVIRTMPNTPAMVGMGVTAICRGDEITDTEFKFVKDTLEKFGTVYELPEPLMDNVIPISGSSPVLAYLLVDAMTKFNHGLDPNTAKRMAAQTVMGACQMILDSDESPETLTDRVCSPGGTTIEMVNTLRTNNFTEIIMASMDACLKRAIEMRKS
ncbi:MAG: glutamate-5-semialdehyde dehydrogenase [Firmicutes bacterium]|nr:glutamate-5-semialdehyde dehydrogenase [Bacillota bacterium]